MPSVEDRYYKIIRILLKILGLWPYWSSKRRSIQSTVIRLMYLSAILVQLAVFITHECTLDLVIEVLSFTFPSIFMLIMYDIYYFKSDMVKEFMERIYYDWKTLRDRTEYNIMHDYADTLKLFEKVFSSLLCIILLTSIIFNAIPMILDVVSPLNESRVHVHIIVEYFIDSSQYSHLFILHLTLCVSFGVITIIGTGLAYFSYGLHICAMFKVANYRMAIILDDRILRLFSPEKEQIIYERLVCAVDIHRKAIEYCNFILFIFGKEFLFLIGIGVTSLSINLFRLLKTMMMFTELMDIFIPVVVVFGHFCYLFFGNHIGQQITNNDAEIFNTVYNLPWYIAPLNVQKLLLFLLQKSQKTAYLTVGFVFVASYEGFAMLIKLSISYFTIIRAIQ